jgi:Protein of unknown function (DUF2568)
MPVLWESGVAAGLAWWGCRAGGGGWTGILLGVLLAIVGFGIWGRSTSIRPDGSRQLRLAEELLISGLAAARLIAAGQARPDGDCSHS